MCSIDKVGLDILQHGGSTLFLSLVFCTGDTKTEDAVHKEPGEEKPEEENDYHRSDEQVNLT